MDDDARYARAKKRVKEIKDFYQHLTTYLVINALLFVINMLTSPGYLWFYWPLFGWGIAVAIHAMSVFGTGRLWGKEWEDRKIREIMEKDHPSDTGG
jgi:hypothetical protein